jgi:hypothetical protein
MIENLMKGIINAILKLKLYTIASGANPAAGSVFLPL